MQEACFGYPAPADAPEGTPPTTIVSQVDQTVLAGQRIGILGANGQGKSTLVKTVARDLLPLGGTMTEGKGLNIGYFAQQEMDVLIPGDSPLEHMIGLVKRTVASGKLCGQDTREQGLRTFLGLFNFSGDMVKQPVGTMSGGEKARLVLCMLVWQRPNLLLLDEPTNHLDLATREALSMALNEFEGTVMLVSHDRALLRAVCDEFWMVSRGGVTPFDGDLDDYQRYLLEEAKRSREAAKKPATVITPAAPPSKKPSPRVKPLRQELEKLEREIQRQSQEQTRLQQQLVAATAVSEISQMGQQLKQVEADLALLEERWLTVGAELEAAQ
jgi:ATP-binding cassette subfamily F protein 3